MRIALAISLLAAVSCGPFEPLPPRVHPPAAAFRPLPPARPGDWLYEHREAGRSPEEYRASHPVRATGRRRVLAFLPVGVETEAQARHVTAAATFTEIWFDLPVRVLPGRDLPGPEGGRWRRPGFGAGPVLQFRTDWFLRRLLPPLVPDDAVCLAAVTPGDLYPEESWNYVFGMATFRQRVAVWSFARHDPAFFGGRSGPDDEVLALRRTCKLVVHELGHCFGLRHCVRWLCVMNGANSLGECDRQPLRLCPDCLAKLGWNRGFDVAGRYGRLQAWFRQRDFAEEEAWLRRWTAR